MRPKEYCMLFTVFLFVSSVIAQDKCTETISSYEVSYENQYYTLGRIESNKSKGFNYCYYLRIPKAVSTLNKNYLLVCTTATGKPNDDINFHDSRVKNACKNSWESQIASKLGVPLLMPVFERSRSNSKYYTHVLDRDVMLIKKGKNNMARLDLQLLAMISDAQELLYQKGIITEKKIILAGFSASGYFANRFTFMHPDIVKAVATGGIGGMPMLPLSIFEKKKLLYPIGVYDIKKITGEDFNEDEYEMIPQLIFMGELDTNDMFQISDNPEDQCVYQVNNQFGKEVSNRWEKTRKILEGTACNIQTITYIGVEHTVNLGIIDDIVSFFKINSGEKYEPLIPSIPYR